MDLTGHGFPEGTHGISQVAGETGEQGWSRQPATKTGRKEESSTRQEQDKYWGEAKVGVEHEKKIA